MVFLLNGATGWSTDSNPRQVLQGVAENDFNHKIQKLNHKKPTKVINIFAYNAYISVDIIKHPAPV